MKSILLLVISLSFVSSVFGQTYTYTTENGRDPYMYYFRGQAQHPFQSPRDDELSEWQELPFEWEFFGETVTGYYISDNGYITFDIGASESIPDNTALDGENVPLNSIFAFWTDLFLEEGHTAWSNEVATATVNTEPERVHIIYWMRVVPKGENYDSNNLGFFIALHEQGGFDIGYTVKTGIGNFKGSVGAINFDGSEILSVEGSPEYIFPTCGYGDDDDVCVLVREGPSGIAEYSDIMNVVNVYPNPFNQLLITNYELLMAGPVSIDLYNSMGYKVAVLVDEYMEAGRHLAVFNAAGLPQGVYYYTIRVGDKTETGQVVLVR